MNTFYLTIKRDSIKNVNGEKNWIQKKTYKKDFNIIIFYFRLFI